MISTISSPRSRLAYIDWLRFLVVLSLAPFHASISFTGMGLVYVYDTPVRDIILAGGAPIGPIVLTEFTVFMDNWFMSLLFFVSGIGAVFSLRKRSGAQFMGERWNRLLLPFLLGILLVVSFQSWLGALSFDKFSGSFLAFIPLFFTSWNSNWGSPRYLGLPIDPLWEPFFYNSMVYGGLINQVFPRVYSKEEFARIKTKVLLLLGEREAIYNNLHNAIRSARELIPNVEVAVIPDAHHITALAQPEKVNRKLLQFFAE